MVINQPSNPRSLDCETQAFNKTQTVMHFLGLAVSGPRLADCSVLIRHFFSRPGDDEVDRERPEQRLRV